MSRKDGEKLNIIYYSLCFPNDDGDEDDGDEEEEELNIVFFPLCFQSYLLVLPSPCLVP